MSFQGINKDYSGEGLFIRYAPLLYNESTIKIEVCKQAIRLGNELKFYAFPISLINSPNLQLAQISVSEFMTKENSESNVSCLVEKEINFLDSIGVNEIEENKQKIIDYLNRLYACGAFDLFNRCSYRFLKKIKNANEYDINDLAIKQLISSIAVNDFTRPLEVLNDLSRGYCLFDYKIYAFILNLIQGDFESALEDIFQINQNISQDLYKLVKEEDIAFYFALITVICFSNYAYNSILSHNNLLIYKLYNDHPKYFKIVNLYARRNYISFNKEFASLLENCISKDPFLCPHYSNITFQHRKSQMKEILKISKRISNEKLKSVLKIKDDGEIENLIRELLNSGMGIVVDDVSKVVFVKEKEPMNLLLEESKKMVEKNIEKVFKYATGKKCVNCYFKSRVEIVPGMDIVQDNNNRNDAMMELYD